MSATEPASKPRVPPWAWLVVLVLVGLGVGTGYWLKSMSPGSPSAAPPGEPEEASLSAPEPFGVQGAPSSTAERPNGWLRTVLGRSLASTGIDAGPADAGLLAQVAVDAGRSVAADEPRPRKRHRAGAIEKDGWLTFYAPIWPTDRTASIQGVVRYAPSGAQLPLIQRGEQFGCPRAPVADPSLEVQNGLLANAVVFVHVDSLSERNGSTSSPVTRPVKPVTVEDVGCLLEPHVSLALGALLNADATFHRIQGYMSSKQLFDYPLYAGTTVRNRMTFGSPVQLKCAVHPWESAYVFPARGPFVAVTGPDGAFHFDALPNNETYVVEAWHERFGSQEMKVEVLDGPATVDFQFGVEPTASK